MSFTTIPAAGAKLRASTLAALLSELRPNCLIRGSDQNLTSNSTTLQDDNTMQFNYPANVRYQLILQMTYKAGTTADFKWAFAWSGSADMVGSVSMFDPSLAYLPTSLTNSTGTTYVAGGAGTGTARSIIVIANFSTHATGLLKVQYAQNVATVETETVSAGSHLWLQQAQ